MPSGSNKFGTLSLRRFTTHLPIRACPANDPGSNGVGGTVHRSMKKRMYAAANHSFLPQILCCQWGTRPHHPPILFIRVPPIRGSEIVNGKR
ncbi:MAG: hypothetical protein V9G20_16540 [Candidatus Promineifilaceae bacterium]